MFVYSPSADVQASPWAWLDVRGGWEADVVSGASVATKAGPAYAHAPAPTWSPRPACTISATSAHGEVALKGNVDVAHGRLRVRHRERLPLELAARERAHRRVPAQHAVRARLRAQLRQRLRPRADAPTPSSPPSWTALEDSRGCFTKAAGRTTRDIAIDTYEASWGQAWTPVLETQLTYTAQLVDGFQSDPYRSVILGEGIKAQEHVPNERAREAVTARLAYYLRSLKGAIRLSLRGYHDTWAIDSGTAELELEKSLGESVRVMAPRPALQAGRRSLLERRLHRRRPAARPARAVLDRGPRAVAVLQLAGRRARRVGHHPPAHQRLLGFIESFKLAGSVNVQGFSYDQYTLGGTPVSNAIAYIATASLSLGF